MTHNKAEVYVIIGNLVYKGMFTLVLCGCLVASMCKLYEDPGWPVSGVVAVLGYCFQQMARHFFPTEPPKQTASIAAAPRVKEIPPSS